MRLSIPASSAYLSLARAATSGVCARLDFPLERLDDLSLAVDEAISLLLLDAAPGTEIVCRWQPQDDGVSISVSSTSSSGRVPRTTTFAWAVLSALVDSVSADIGGDQVTITMAAQRAEAAVS